MLNTHDMTLQLQYMHQSDQCTPAVAVPQHDGKHVLEKLQTPVSRVRQSQ